MKEEMSDLVNPRSSIHGATSANGIDQAQDLASKVINLEIQFAIY